MDNLSPEARFIRHWHSSLIGCKDAPSAQALLKQNKEGGGTITMNDGSWISVVMEQECCTGAGFNATVYVTSTGEAYADSVSCYCGWMPLGEELSRYSKTSVDAFLAAVRSGGNHLTRLPR